jgi:hypothetical protein
MVRGERLVARMLIEVLREGQCVRFVARGGSMWPAIRDGAWVEVVPCVPTSMQIDELVAFEGRRGLVVHRVLERCDTGLRIGGDARDQDDGVVPFGKVLGRAHVLVQAPLVGRLPRAREVYGLLRAGTMAARSWLRRVRGQT